MKKCDLCGKAYFDRDIKNMPCEIVDEDGELLEEIVLTICTECGKDYKKGETLRVFEGE